ncbi:MAG: hypothetical protein L6R41_007983, partial [Letrouitia leprolyta]
MSHLLSDFHIATLLDRAAATEAGITTYLSTERLKPTSISYKELRALAASKANLLQRHTRIRSGRIILIHFHDHLETIIWFWAAVVAGCVPALSTPLVRNSQGRLAHFQHLHRLLQNPTVLTNAQLANSDFVDNDILQVIAVEDVESAGFTKAADATQYQTHDPGNVFRNGKADQIIHGPECISNHPKSNADGILSDPKKHVPNGLTDKSSNPISEVQAHTNGQGHNGTCSLEGVAVLMLTSGSTGSAKAVCLTHTQLFAAMAGKISAMPLPAASSLLNWIGLDHVASLVEIHLCAMYAGLSQVHVTAAEILGDPLQLLRLVSVHDVSRTFAPNFFLRKLQQALDDSSIEETRGINLNGLLYIASGGEANKVDTCVRVNEHLMELACPQKSVIIPGFGMTETCAGAIFNTECPFVDIDARRDFASLGTCVPGIEMRISPVTNAILGSTETDGSFEKEGALEIRGPIVFEKYFNDHEATQRAFTDDGWFTTGDLATTDASGNLNLVGRSKELININGIKYLPHELEATINEANITGITPSYVVCFADRPAGSDTEEMYIVYQHEYHSDDSEARMGTLHSILHVIALFAGARPRVLPLPWGRLDKTALGKLSRSKIQTSLAQGQYYEEEAHNDRMLHSYHELHHSSPRDKMEMALSRMIAETLSIDDLQIGIDTLIFDIGINSVDLIRLKRLSEKAFDIADIPIVTFLTNTTIRTLAIAIKHLQTSCYTDVYNPVVTLQHNGTKTPLWLIHPGIGEILVFLGLVQYFPNRPVYGLRARGFNPGETPFNGLAEVVSTYYQALKKQQPDGPYAIAGYSYGSMLAFEISKILEANGDT